MRNQLSISCDNLVTWEDPVDATDGTAIGTDGTGSVTLKDNDGNAVSGASALSLTYDAGPPIIYYATIPTLWTLLRTPLTT
jgi:hypothetical protein